MSVGTVTIQVSPQAADALRHMQMQAELQQIPFEVYLQSLAKNNGDDPSGPTKDAPLTPLSPQEKVAFLNEWIAGLKRDTPLLSDEAISRDSIYAHEVNDL